MDIWDLCQHGSTLGVRIYERVRVHCPGDCPLVKFVSFFFLLPYYHYDCSIIIITVLFYRFVTTKLQYIYIPSYNTVYVPYTGIYQVTIFICTVYIIYAVYYYRTEL